MRVVVADDSVLLREGLQLLLAEADHEVVASAGDGPGFVAAMLEHRPDLGLVDVRMPPDHTDEGLRAAVEVRERWPEARLVVLSQYVVGSYADELLGSVLDALPAPKQPGEGRTRSRRVSTAALSPAGAQPVIVRPDGSTVEGDSAGD